MQKINCDTAFIGKQYIWLDSTGSTNDVIKHLLKDSAAVAGTLGDMVQFIEGEPGEGLTVIADHQTDGRGRSGRQWCDENGSNIAMSVLLMPPVDVNSISMVTLMSAMATACAIEKKSGIAVSIKWPNDLIAHDKKLCGILTELVNHDGKNCVIIGIGINVNMTDIPEDLKDRATSMLIESGADSFYDRAAIVEAVLKELERYYSTFVKTADMTALREEYNKRLINMDRAVKVLDPSEPLEGIARGIDESGCLEVETSDGEIHKVYAGEVSVRGMDGYV